MSGEAEHNQLAPNADSDPKDVASEEEQAVPTAGEQDQTPDLGSPPLPDFFAENDDSPGAAATSSRAGPSNLDNLLTGQRTEKRSGPHGDKPSSTYRVSPAAPDLSRYTLPPLEEPPPEEEDSGSGWQTTWAIVREVGETIILTLIIFFLIQMVVRNFRVVGTSMADNLHDGQYLIIDKLSYNPLLTDYLGLGGPQRGDVVVFEPPRRPDEDYVKRIIGLPGEEVQVIKGQVYINGELLPEPFQPRHGTYTMSSPMVVPADQVFVLGDNRNNSNDSHNWGPLPIENIVGRAWLSYWPPDQWGAIPRDSPTEEATLKYYIGDLIPSANAKSE